MVGKRILAAAGFQTAAAKSEGLAKLRADFTRTVEFATRSGQDSDCNPANAAGILGVMLG